MKIKELNIEGVFEIELIPRYDERGFFMRTFDENFFLKDGINRSWVQENHSLSKNKFTLRGLHFQRDPYSETKLVRCIKGEALDVFVDLRKKSKTFAQWGSIVLSEEKKNMVYIPRNFAHGYCTLTDGCEIIYKVDNYYTPDAELGILWCDTHLNINWPTDNPVLSYKDSKLLAFKNLIESL